MNRFSISVLILAGGLLGGAAWAKSDLHLRLSHPYSDKYLERHARLNRLVSLVHEAQTNLEEKELAVVEMAASRPKAPTELSFTEQRNLLILEGVELRPDWFKYVREAIASRADLGARERLVRLYFSYLQTQAELARDDRAFLSVYQAEAEARVAFAMAKVNFSLEIARAREEGHSAANLIETRNEVYGEDEITPGEEDSLYARDRKLAERAYASALKTLNHLGREIAGVDEDLRVTGELIHQAKAAAKTLPLEWSHVLYRQRGLPVVDRAGRLLTIEDWRALGQIELRREAAAPKGSAWSRLRAACANLLKGKDSDA